MKRTICIKKAQYDDIDRLAGVAAALEAQLVVTRGELGAVIRTILAGDDYQPPDGTPWHTSVADGVYQLVIEVPDAPPESPRPTSRPRRR